MEDVVPREERKRMKIIKMKNCKEYEERFVIIDDNDKIIDDARGYGYKSKQSAYKVMNYKFKGGKQKKQKTFSEKRKFINQHKDLEKFINNIYEINCKEIALGEVSLKDIQKSVKEEFNIDIPEDYLK